MKFSNTRLTTALLATTALMVGAVEIRANLTAHAELRAFLARNPNASVAGIFVEPFSGRLSLRGVAYASGKTRLDVGHLDLPLPGPTLGQRLVQHMGIVTPAIASPFDDQDEGKKTAPAASQEKSVPPPAPAPAPAPQANAGTGSADDITLTSGPVTVHIKRMEMVGTSLSKADFAAIVDPKNTEPAEARFKKLTATAIVIPEVAIDTKTDASESHVTVSQVLLSGASQGKIAAGSAGRTVINQQSKDGQAEGEIGAVQATNLDLVQIARVFNSIRSDDAEPIRPLYDSVTVTGASLSDKTKKSTISFTTLRETGAKARPLATDFITASRNRDRKPTDAETKAAFDDMTHSIEIGAMELNDLSVRTEDKDGVNTFSLAGVALHDFAKNKVGGFTLRALRFEGGEAKFGIGSVDVGALTLPATKSLPTSATDSSAFMTNAKADLRDIFFDGVTKDKEKGGPPQRIAFKLNHVGVISDGEPGDLPKASKLTVDNLTFDVPPSAGQAAPLIDMGYKHLDLSAALSTNYNPAGQELTIDNLAVNGVEMGSVGIGFDLANVTKGIISPNKDVAVASAMAILVKGLKLDVLNAGLFDRALAWKAKQDGMTVDQERAQAVDFFANKLPASMNNNANVKKVGEAIAKFCAVPKGLHISIISKNGLGAASMGMLQDPGLLLDTLDVKATND